MNTKQVLVPIADGSEEIETSCITDTLTRFGASVTVASVMSRPDDSLVCTMSRGLKIMADCTMQEAIAKGNDYWDMVVLPGGMPGATHLRDCPQLIDLLQHQKSKQYAAICASPAVVLATHNLIEAGTQATCYPAPQFLQQMEQQLQHSVSGEAVVKSGNLTTGQGPASALDFALSLGETLFGKEKRDQIAKEMLRV
jgi:protein deglycase